MALTIYGSPRSRTMRTLWAAAELGLAYTHVPLAWNDPALKEPEFLRLNSAGTIPTIVDDDFALGYGLDYEGLYRNLGAIVAGDLATLRSDSRAYVSELFPG